MGFNPAADQVVARVGGALGVIGAMWIAGFLVVLTSKEAIALHDHVCGTSVVAN